jgi:uncharacterized membrane protein YhdT
MRRHPAEAEGTLAPNEVTAWTVGRTADADATIAGFGLCFTAACFGPVCFVAVCFVAVRFVAVCFGRVVWCARA